MRLAVISCVLFTRPLCRAVAQSKNDCRVWYVEQGLHNTPSAMPGKIQEIVDEIERLNAEAVEDRIKFKAIVLAYGLCSNGICGVTAKDIPIIVPRTDDCIAIFLGSQKKYMKLFNDPGGIYWYNAAWFEQADIATDGYRERLKAAYERDYDEETAEYLADTIIGPLENYRYAVYITSQDDRTEYTEATKKAAKYFGWDYMDVEGDESMLKRLIDGDWDNEEEFLTVMPGQSIEQSFDERKLKAQDV